MIESTCTNIDESGSECSRPVVESSPVSLCQIHLMLAAQFTADMGGFGTGLMAVGARGGTGARLKFGRPQVVYYLQTADRIKIGTTTDLPRRLGAIAHDVVLAAEPGDNALERRRHRQFAALHVDREWFTADSHLVEFAAALRTKHGDPMALWARLVNRHAT